MGKLSQLKISALQPRARPYRVADEHGLALLVSVVGGKSWQGRYRSAGGKEQILSLGQWPVVSIKQAREKWLEARIKRANNIDPVAEKRNAKNKLKVDFRNNFDAAWAEWTAVKSKGWGQSRIMGLAQRHGKYLSPVLGQMPMASPDLSDKLLSVLRQAESAGHLSVSKVILADCGQFARYCIAARYIQSDFTIGLGQLLESTPATESHPALVKPADVAVLMRDIFAYSAKPLYRDMLIMSALLFVRPNELRATKWSDVDLELAEWRTKTKTGAILVVPLPRQAIAILQKIRDKKQMLNGYVYHVSDCNAPVSRDAVNKVLKKLGYEKRMSLHGFRAMARTILDEVLRQDVRFIEMQLGHVVKDHLGTAYNRTVFLDDRREMMQLWADWIYKIAGVE